jgi:hypothetical protein
MHAPYNVELALDSTPGHTHVDNLSQESANKVSELLMPNHANYRILFNEVGLHSKKLIYCRHLQAHPKPDHNVH